MIDIKKKRDFLRHILANWRFKKIECGWILQYMLNHSIILKKLKIVNNVKGKELGMEMSVQGMEDDAFYYCRGEKLVWLDPERAHMDLRNSFHLVEEICLKINFPNKYQNIYYLEVVEDGDEVEDEEFAKIAEMVTELLELNYHKEQIMKKIDECLENGDKEGFYSWSEEYKKVGKNILSLSCF